MTEERRHLAYEAATAHLPSLTDGEASFLWLDSDVAALRLACAKRFDESVRTETLFTIAATAIRLAKARGVI